MASDLYHERQSLQLCALHCVNNLLQEEAFKKKDFDGIAYELTPGWFRNPHRSIFGTGNYDVNVIMRALKRKGYTVKWFDKRKSVDTDIEFDKLFGLIINQNNTSLLSKIWASRHWIAYTNIDGTFYNTNSALRSPKPFESLDKLKENIKKIIEGENNQSQLLLVIKDEQTSC